MTGRKKESVRREPAVTRQMPQSCYLLGMLLLAEGKRAIKVYTVCLA